MRITLRLLPSHTASLHTRDPPPTVDGLAAAGLRSSASDHIYDSYYGPPAGTICQTAIQASLIGV